MEVMTVLGVLIAAFFVVIIGAAVGQFLLPGIQALMNPQVVGIIAVLLAFGGGYMWYTGGMAEEAATKSILPQCDVDTTTIDASFISALDKSTAANPTAELWKKGLSSATASGTATSGTYSFANNAAPGQTVKVRAYDDDGSGTDSYFAESGWIDIGCTGQLDVELQLYEEAAVPSLVVEENSGTTNDGTITLGEGGSLTVTLVLRGATKYAGFSEPMGCCDRNTTVFDECVFYDADGNELSKISVPDRLKGTYEECYDLGCGILKNNAECERDLLIEAADGQNPSSQTYTLDVSDRTYYYNKDNVPTFAGENEITDADIGAGDTTTAITVN